MNIHKAVTLIVVSALVAILIASALNGFTRVSDSALAETAPTRGTFSQTSLQNAPRTAHGKNYLPIIFLNSATAGGAWLLAGNAGTNPTTDFLGTTDSLSLTFRVSNTVAFRLAPAVDPTYGFAPDIIGGFGGNTVAPGVFGATIGGGGVSGYVNDVSGDYATIGGGFNNLAQAYYASVGGGYENIASYQWATVGGGDNNQATGLAATVPGGYHNWATGDYSFAAGQFANTNTKKGAFVWADAITTTVLNATRGNQFLVRATGGISFATNAALTTGCSIPAGGGSWNCTSDKNVKTNFANVDSRDILAQVNALPITTWNYTTQDASIRHIGPMAQDFAAAFNVGENDTTISTVDAQGVALAAIQGLAQENQDLKTQNANLEAQVASLQSQNAAQQKVNASLDARLTAIEQSNDIQSPNPLQGEGASAFALNNLPLWGIVGLLALWLVRRRR